ncbi:hypothetical protein ACT3CE_11640 [Marinifilum sp. RC60d5]|uniref:hypothetical protein n=1 Tax=Marinifilum sp. RC60d5 TaxID=3458414 RepID=UPI00403527AE
MRKLIGFNIKRNKKLLVSDIVKFYEVRGYELIRSNAKGMLFKRGSIWGNMTSLTPVKWRTKVEVEILKKERMNYNIYANYEFSTSGLFRSKEEENYYSEEINAFSKAIENFEVDSKLIDQLALKIYKSSRNYMLKALILGIITALVLVFISNLFLKENLPILFAFGITVISIFAYYYAFTSLGNK